MNSFFLKSVSKGVVILAALFASGASAEIPQSARDAQIVVLGEQHDNPAHHTRQAEWVAELSPSALVLEMLTPDQAANAQSGWHSKVELNALTGWSETAWPSFDMYYPIFAAAPNAAIYGAGVTRETLQEVLQEPLATLPLAARFGLAEEPAPEQQGAREALQAQAHCGVLPEDALPMMVNAQRHRDIALADAALRALRETGGPVVVITGNGHARIDWGMPALVNYAAPDVSLFALGQGEDGADVQGSFTLTLDAPAPERGDPCLAFTR